MNVRFGPSMSTLSPDGPGTATGQLPRHDTPAAMPTLLISAQSASCYRDSTACVPRLFSAVTGAMLHTHLGPLRSDPSDAEEGLVYVQRHGQASVVTPDRRGEIRAETVTKARKSSARPRAPKGDPPGRSSRFRECDRT